MAKKPSNRLKAYLLLSVTTIIWGSAFILIKPSFAITTPIRFLLYRYFFASLVSVPIFWHHYQSFFTKKSKKVQHKIAWQILLIELFGGVFALIALYTGLNYASVIETSLLSSTTPILIVLAGILILKEKEERNEAIGLLLAMIGTLILAIAPIIGSKTNGQVFSLLGSGLILLHNFLVAGYYVTIKKAYKKLPKFFVTTVSFYLCLVSFFILALAELNFSLFELASVIRLEMFNLTVLIPSLYMGVLGSIIASTVNIKGQQYIEVSEASLFQYLQPMVAVPLSIVFLKETISLWQIIALTIILCGVWLAEAKRK